MMRTLCLLCSVIAVQPALAASYTTSNFRVEAAEPEIARHVGEAAERQRNALALKWLGKELPDWSERCLILVTISWERPGGVSTIEFDSRISRVRTHKIELSGPLDRLLTGPLPHEMTHVLIAHHLGRPAPRWADEGGAVLSEGAREQELHTLGVARALKSGASLSLRRLWELRDYYRPDLAAFYGQAHSVTAFLVEKGGCRKFLDFVDQGLAGDWDRAVTDHYGYANVEQAEEAWLAWQRKSATPRTTAKEK